MKYGTVRKRLFRKVIFAAFSKALLDSFGVIDRKINSKLTKHGRMQAIYERASFVKLSVSNLLKHFWIIFGSFLAKAIGK